MLHMHIGLHLGHQLFLSDFSEIWIFPTDFSKNTEISNFMKKRPVWAELFHEDWDGRRDKHDEADFCMPANELKNASVFPLLSAFHSPNFASQTN
jgi:hypothetical protein